LATSLNLDFLVPRKARDNPRLARRYRGISTSLLAISLVVSLLFFLYLSVRNAPQPVEFVLFALSIFGPIVGLLFIRWTGKFVLGLLLTNLLGIVLVTCLAWVLGGIYSFAVPWYLTLLALLVTYGDIKTSFLTLCMVIAANFILYYGTVTGEVPASLLPPSEEARAWITSVTLALFLLFLGMALAIRRNSLVKHRLQTAKLEAERASHAKSAFLASMSHELRTPLNAISGFSQLILHLPHDNMTSQQEEAVKIVTESSAHLLTLINQLLDLSKIEEGNLETRRQDVALAPLFTESIALVVPTATEKSLKLVLEEPSADTAVLADRVQLFQCLLNLMSNAVKYNRVGGRLVLRCVANGTDHIRIEVLDNGHGIALPLQARVFKAFDRLNKEGEVSEGTGIGLHITKRLIEGMGGTIGFESTEGKGTLFWIDLPRAKTT